MRNGSAKRTAFGGMMAAVATVIMCLGGLIPVATYVCPMLCTLVLALVLRVCGVRIAWAWYAVVALLSLLMAPDREGAAVFLFLGYYPILKPCLDRTKAKWLWKGLLFNGAVTVMYALMIFLFGVAQLAMEFRKAGTWLLLLMLLAGNLTFFLLDRVLSRFGGKKE